MKFVLQYQDQFGNLHRYQEKQNEGDACRTDRREQRQRSCASGSLMPMIA